MSHQEQIEKVLNRSKDIKEIKLENCKIYNEYSIIVLYQNDSDIIICDNSEDVKKIYDFLTKELNKQKIKNNKATQNEIILEK